MASLLVFGTVISDAAMVDRVIGMDVHEAAAARDRVPRRDRGMAERPGRREVEGIGGSGTSFWPPGVRGGVYCVVYCIVMYCCIGVLAVLLHCNTVGA